ncbi:MAG: AgmX/PglI C-terminal domain-containing protein [Deltaproteobacteria bacterium]|nr:AgmX/PglI C-terminal domain-containing protein [Deltaproteobacteria bacterium]
MAHRPRPSWLCAALLGLGGGASCGGGQPSTGGLSQGGVQAAFAAAMPEVERCLRAGRARLPYLGGDIEALVEIDEQGRATGAYLGRSTLGDEQVEECILEAYRSRPWPRPVGGKTGQARQGYSFGAAPDQPAPLDWKPDALAAAMEEEARRERAEAGHDGGPDAATAAPSSPFAELVAKLGRCRTEPGAGRIEITMYLDEDGMVQSVGLATSDARSRAALGCIAMVVKTTSFPSPGNQIAKVTMGIE